MWYNNILILWVIIIVLIIIIVKLFQRKPKKTHSDSVRWGFDFEKFVPWMKKFPYKPKDTIPIMGPNPIDYLVIDLDKRYLRVIEVKTGKSQLNEREKELKRIIDEGRVTYEVIRDD